MSYFYTVTKGVHVYFSRSLKRIQAFKAKHGIACEVFATEYPHFYGFAHSVDPVRNDD